jgi:WD40 repeat protein
MASVGFDFNYKIAISLDGAWVLFRQEPNLLVVTDSVTGQQFNTLKLSPFKYRRKNIAITAVAKSINQLWLIFVYEDNTFDEWFLAQIFAENTEKQSNPPFIYRAVSQNGQWALRETKRRCFQLHDLKANEITSLGYSLLPEIKKNDEYFWEKIILSNDAKFVITPKLENDFLDEGYNYERGLRYFDLINKNPIPILENDSYTSFSLSDDNKVLVLGFENGKIEYYRLGNGEKFSSILLHQSSITSIKTKFIDGVLTTLSTSENGQIILFTHRATAFKLENHVSLALFSPDNKNLIIGDIIGGNLDREQYHLFEVITASVTTEKISLFLSSQETIENNSSNNYYILSGYDESKNEVVYYYLQKNNERIILLFESSINAHFFNQKILKEDNFITFTVEKVSEKHIKTFCEQLGYSWEVIFDKQDALIEKSLHFREIPRIDLYITFWMVGPGFLNFKLYLNQRLYYKREIFIDESRLSALPFFPIPSLNIWTDDLNGSLLFFFPSSHVYYKINFKISCLIANNQDGKTYMDLYYACVRADYQIESILLNFLEQQEKLLGRTHEKLIETLNNLYNIYSKQGKTTEAVAIMQRKEELEELYKPEEIILAASDACWMRAFIGEQETYPILDSSYIRFNVSPDKIFTPPLTLNIENEIMNSGEVIDIKKSDNNIELNTTKQIHVIYLVQEIRVLLSQIFENFQLIVEPDTNKIRLLKRIWNDIKLLFHKFDFQEDGQYLIHKIKTSQLSRQLKKFLKNPNNISHPAILVTFIIPVILFFIIGQDNNFSFTFKEITLTQNPLFLLRELISIFCFSFLTIVVLGSLAITPILNMPKPSNIDLIILPNLISYSFTNKLSEREQKWLVFPTIVFIPFYLLTFLIITISAIFVGISLTKEIAIDWTMKLATQPYWLIIISIGLLTWLGDLGEWILRKQRYRLSNTAAAIVGAIVANLLGNYLNQIFGKHFDPNSLLFNSSLAAVGGYGGATQDRKNKNFIGALGAALASVYFINKYPLQVFSLITPSIEALSEKILYLIGLLIGILSGGFIGGFVGLLIGFFLATLFAFATFYFSFGVYHLAQQVTNDFQERGYSKTFTSIILMIITLFGSAFGLILSLIF